MLDYVIQNIGQISLVVTSVISACAAVAALTPNKTDDLVLNKILQVVNLLALNVGKAQNKDK